LVPASIAQFSKQKGKRCIAVSQQNPPPARRCRSAPPFHLQQNLFDSQHSGLQFNLTCRNLLFTLPRQDKAERCRIYQRGKIARTLDMEPIHVYSAQRHVVAGPKERVPAFLLVAALPDGQGQACLPFNLHMACPASQQRIYELHALIHACSGTR
jgi:hypothetical protein